MKSFRHSLIHLTFLVAATAFTPLTTLAAPALSVDINERGADPSSTTMPGFNAFLIDAIGGNVIQNNPTTRTIGLFNVTLSGLGGDLAHDDRLRATPVNSGLFTDSLLLRDFVFSRSEGLSLEIDGLTPDQFYEVTIWSYDTGSPGNRVSDWTANGILVIDNYAFNGSNLPTNNEQYQFKFKVAASPAGIILIEARGDVSSSNPFACFLNAFQLQATLPDAPTITTQPANTTVYEGQYAIFRAQASGTIPISYQWLKDGLEIDGATASTLVLSNLQPADATSYSVRASNPSGSDTSLDATLSIIPVDNLQTALLAYWPLDAIIGTSTPDLSGNDQALTLVNMDANNSVPGPLNQAFTFDGATEILVRNTIGDGLPAYANGAYSVTLWVNGNGVGQNDRRVFSEGSDSSNNPLLNIGTNAGGTNGAVDIYIRTTTGSPAVNHRQSTAEAFDGTWHHIAWVDDNGFARLYIDGVLDPTDFTYGAGTLDLNNISLGAIQRSTACCWFNGSIDDVAVWGRAITPAEITETMNGGLSLPMAITSFTIENGNIVLTVRTPQLSFYIVEETSSLVNPVWTDTLNVEQTGFGTASLTATFPAPANGQRFYRIREESL